MGGGGVKVGEIVGATDQLGEFVVDNPVTPQDLAATIYAALGIPLHTWYHSQDGRPVELVRLWMGGVVSFDRDRA